VPRTAKSSSVVVFGRLWQTLILSRWNPLFAFLPVESVIRDRQADCYRVLASCDNAGNSTAFIEFLLAALRTAQREVANLHSGEQVSEQVSEQVVLILQACAAQPQPKVALLESAGLAQAYLNYKRHILPLLESGLIEMTIPDKPRSRLQKYRITSQGRAHLQQIQSRG